ncbi:DHA2 family efflux MFS transporter permease subunit [Legionella waltersii]|uniref:MFS transporter DHA2 family multidrug resistance protein B n=1 Tax=Legionella waltersii TaxID=66969 RepID=A0A0W1AAR8_9GAMM|nr:DHA2 family efflux MFS transporter permease subunit [Legionella waltersii]KTD78460.1 MFS transporter DHA2 family multidrug resistance protein B [Legionella waltersii]SNV05933.1 MFS transporter DHA2 family multidrug resistance protein B [Legionella waltersii]
MRPNGIIFVVSCAMFMEAMDTTIINTAIPVMAQSFNVNPIDLKLALISYLLSLAVFIPISGWIADKYGIKKVFIGALILFTLSSIWCGLTQSLWELIFARVIQGLGGSLSMPIGRMIILKTSERHEIISKMSVVVMVASLGLLLGPLLGGIITVHFSWRWIFWVNIPVGILTVLLALKTLPDIQPNHVPPLDKSGFVLFGTGLASLTLGLSMFSESRAGLTESIIILIFSALLLFAYAKHSQNRANPIVKINLLKTRTFRISVLGNLLARLSFGGAPFLLPLFFQIILGYSPRLSGLLLAPMAIGVFLVKPMSFKILQLLGHKTLLIWNTCIVGICLWSFSTINSTTSIYEISVLTFIYGFFIALQYTGMNSLAYARIDDPDISAATSIMTTTQQLSQSFGVAIAALLVTVFTYSNPTHSSLTLTLFHNTFIALACLTVFSGAIFTGLKKDDGRELFRNSSKI